MSPKIFYQSSLPRAGLTLLQNILAQNPAFYVTPTSGLLELIFGARLNYTNSPEFKAPDPPLDEKEIPPESRQVSPGGKPFQPDRHDHVQARAHGVAERAGRTRPR